jgi:hypothetical protein
MKIGEGLFGKKKGSRCRAKSEQERGIRGEYEQNTLYSCMTVIINPLFCTINKINKNIFKGCNTLRILRWGVHPG